MNENKQKNGFSRKIAGLIISLALILPLGIVIIVDWHLNSELTWSLFPIYGIIFAWGFIAVPLFLKNWHIKYHFAMFLGLLIPYLLLIFWQMDFAMGLEVVLDTVSNIVAIIIIYFVFKLGKFNKAYKICVSILILAVSNLISQVVIRDFASPLGFWVSTFVLFVLAVAFGIAGFYVSNKKRD